MRIGELAKRALCDVETVRFYEHEKLIDTPNREANGYRFYVDKHLQQLKFIRHCRSLDMGLPDVCKLLQLQSAPELACDDINDLIDSQITRIHQKVEALRLLKQQLHTLRDSCDSHEKIRNCGILKNLEQAAKGEDCDCHAEAEQKLHLSSLN